LPSSIGHNVFKQFVVFSKIEMNEVMGMNLLITVVKRPKFSAANPEHDPPVQTTSLNIMLYAAYSLLSHIP
jgi:hypothetical protein